MDRIAPTRRHRARAQGFQRWNRLLFSHWTVPEAALRPLVPARLSLDTFEGRCYVGVVAFTMQKVRPWLWAPVIPGGQAFGEINLRTYVHVDGEEPGVFFFSLDAANRLVVIAARMLWGLPYFHSDVQILDAADAISFGIERRSSNLSFAAHAQIGALQPPPDPESLEFFLCERYQFYAEVGGRLRRARVHHAPYPLHAVEKAEVDDSLLVAAGLPTDGARTRDLFSPGVDVDVFALEDV